MSDTDNGSAPFPGFRSPAYTMVPDEVVDVLLPDLSGAELKVLLYIARRTFGFGKAADNISIAQLCTGITTRDGVVKDRGTGLSNSTVTLAVRGLVERGVLLAQRRRDPVKGDLPTTYALHMAEDTPVRENRTPPPSKIAQALPRKSHTQETVEQETDLFSKRARPRAISQGKPRPAQRDPERYTHGAYGICQHCLEDPCTCSS